MGWKNIFESLAAGNQKEAEADCFALKLKRLVTPLDLGCILLDSFSHKESIRLVSSLGIVYPGVRIETVPYPELAMNLADEAWRDPELLSAIERELDKTHHRELEEMRNLSVEEVRERALSGYRRLCDQNAAGIFVWLLLKDPRPEITGLLKPFLKSVRRYFRRERRKITRIEDFMERLTDGNLTLEDAEEIKRLFGIFSVKLDDMEKLLKQTEKKAGVLSRDNTNLKERVAALSHENGQLAARVGELKKELERRLAETRRLEAAAQKPSRSETVALRHRAKELERELDKKEYALSQSSRTIAGLEQRLQSEESLRRTLGGELEKTRVEIKSLRENRRSLQEDTEKETPLKSKPIPPPKEKGRRLGVFIDAQHLWRSAKQFNRKIDFQKLLGSIVLGRHLVKAVAYVVSVPGVDQEAFFEMLKRKGFEVRSRPLVRGPNGMSKTDGSVGVAADVIHSADTLQLDIVHMVSGDGDFADGLKFLKDKGMRVELSGFSSQTAQHLIQCADDFFALDDAVFQPQI